MDFKLVKEKDNPLLSRKRVTFEGAVDNSTPSRLSLRERVAKSLKTDSNKVIIRHIYTRFGSRNIRVIAHVYESEKDLNNTEDKHAVKRNLPPKKEAESSEG